MLQCKIKKFDKIYNSQEFSEYYNQIGRTSIKIVKRDSTNNITINYILHYLKLSKTMKEMFQI